MDLPARRGPRDDSSYPAPRGQARIVVLTIYQRQDVYAARSRRGGLPVQGHVVQGSDSRDPKVCAGGSPWPHVKALLDQRARTPALTAREVEIIKLVAEGMRNREIAEELHVREETVGVHLRNIFAKLNVNDRTSAVSVSLRRGIIHID
jgi:DNA-binding CsgD family transcriptional regulator